LKALEKLPRVGINRIAVEVITKDPQLIHAITLTDIELVVEYLPHRNALRAKERYFD